MTAVIISAEPVWIFRDNNNNPLVGGKLFCYQAGTTTKQAAYTDSTGTTQLPNPIILNARGETATATGASCGVWLANGQAYKFVIAPATDTDPPTNPIWTVDNYTTLGAGYSSSNADVFSVAASGVFSYTLSGNPGSIANLDVSIDGATLVPGADYSWTAPSTLTFTAAPLLGQTILVRYVQSLGTVATQNTPYYATTSQEIAAVVTPSNYAYPPGDLRRYGATLNGNITAAFTAAINQALQAGGAAVYWPSAIGSGCTITAALPTITVPITIGGDNWYDCAATTANDITILMVSASGSQGCLFHDFRLIGKGAGATQPGIAISGSPFNTLRNVWVTAFGYGVRFLTGGYSSFLNTLDTCKIISNVINNIDCQSQTHQLHLKQVTFGGGGAQIGLHLIDSSGLTIEGGDCEGVSVCCIDLDNSFAGNGGHKISGCDLEANTCSSGDIRVGNTFMVKGVVVQNVNLSPGAGDLWFANLIRCTGFKAENILQDSGYYSGYVFNLGNVAPWNNSTSYLIGNLVSNGGVNYVCVLGNTNQAPPNATYWSVAPTQPWSGVTAYVTGNLATLNGVPYVAVASSTNQSPISGGILNNGYWALAVDAIAIDDSPTLLGPNTQAISGVRTTIGLTGDGLTPAFGAAVAITANAFVIPTNTASYRALPNAAYTGGILQSGVIQNQKFTLFNEGLAASTLTMAAVASSNVADGVSHPVAGLTATTYRWNSLSTPPAWYRDG
jgi:hypothetical protein